MVSYTAGDNSWQRHDGKYTELSIAILKSYDFYTTRDLQLFEKYNKLNTCLMAYSEYDAYLRENGLSREYFR